jgi:adenylate kinase
MLRQEIRSGTPSGNAAREVMARGELVPDDLVGELVERRLKDPECSRGFVLDGYPRNMAQVHRLSSFLSGERRALDHVLSFRVPMAELLRRLTGRRVCGSCGAAYHLDTHPSRAEGICDVCGGGLLQRPDDGEDVVRDRLQIFEIQTRPILETYRQDGILFEVDGTGAPGEVTEHIISVLDESAR